MAEPPYFLVYVSQGLKDTHLWTEKNTNNTITPLQTFNVLPATPWDGMEGDQSDGVPGCERQGGSRQVPTFSGTRWALGVFGQRETSWGVTAEGGTTWTQGPLTQNHRVG